jgi:hypothetical protein
MNRPLRRALMALAGVVVTAPATVGASGGGAITQTQHFPTASQSSPDVNPCTGGTGTFTQTLKGVAHTTIANGVVHYTNTVEGTVAFVPDAPSQASYSGHGAFWDGGSFNVSDGIGVGRFADNVNVRGTDGSHIVSHENAYATLDANGNPISIKFDHVVLTCG